LHFVFEFNVLRALIYLTVLAFAVVPVNCASPQEREGFFDWVHGDWYLSIGAAASMAPEFEGADKRVFRAAPMVSLGKRGPQARFVSRNDNISFALLDTGPVRAGAAGKIVLPRNEEDSDDLSGLDPVKWGAEAGGFAEIYPTDWLRLRGELRQGIRAHHGIVADVAADAFADVTETVRISGGPRLSIASADYFEAYYGVGSEESAKSGLKPYHPGGGLKSFGTGGAVTWKATEKVTASLSGEYARLAGPAADSSLVKERGSVDQFMIGLSTTYRFDFTVP
jgi:outer membrane scaffolding protein for murein synthesis (MipA/OmpV family)